MCHADRFGPYRERIRGEHPVSMFSSSYDSSLTHLNITVTILMASQVFLVCDAGEITYFSFFIFLISISRSDLF